MLKLKIKNEIIGTYSVAKAGVNTGISWCTLDC